RGGKSSQTTGGCSERVSETYAHIERITRRCMRPSGKPDMTARIDNIVLHKWLALPLFVLVMTGVYYLAATGPGAWLGAWLEGVISGAGAALGRAIPSPWLGALVQEGVLGGAGMLLGFVPQLMMVFLCLSVLEASGYLSRVAFLLDAALRKFGLSGKCFMPMLLATGCSVPAILATRAIDCPRQRRTVAATCSFVPCSAKLPIIALMANGVFSGAWWLAPLMYFVGAAAMLGSAFFATFFEKKVTKKTLTASRWDFIDKWKKQAPALLREGGCRTVTGGSPAFVSREFILEMPQYRLPSGQDIARTAWRRTAEFMKKAGSVIVLSGVFVWLLSGFLQPVGSAIAWLFVPLGFGFWRAAVATLTAFIAKENAVATLGVLGAAAIFTPAQGMSFLLFNLLSMPCAAAVAALRCELGSAKRTVAAVAWQCGLAYVVAGCAYWLMR
ncbi:MAG: ferrous iron transporter B, partial [Oscillospiraceae bacterium]|nr:ferrous iron transporter B [Oscillospiraceae bacterium]